MKFSKTITVEINAEPTSEEWFVELYDSTKVYDETTDYGIIKTEHFTTYEELFKAVPKEYKELVAKAFASPLEKKYKNAQHQFWTIREETEEAEIQISLCHYYHFEADYSTHIKF